jgi:hypothetical protein
MRLVGMVPARLDALLEDLQQPGVAELPAPFRSTSPVRLVEVMTSEPTANARRPR